MKIKIVLAATLALLFVAVPSATPKGKGGGGLGVAFDLSCNEVGSPDSGTDSCSVTASGLTVGTTYFFDFSDDCGRIPYSRGENAPGFSYSVTFSDGPVSGCTITSITSNLWSIAGNGRRTLLGTSTVLI